MTKIDFTQDLRGRKIQEFPHCVFPIRLPRSVDWQLETFRTKVFCQKKVSWLLSFFINFNKEKWDKNQVFVQKTFLAFFQFSFFCCRTLILWWIFLINTKTFLKKVKQKPLKQLIFPPKYMKNHRVCMKLSGKIKMHEWFHIMKQIQCSQCENFMIFISLRFYVKSISGIIEVQNLHF